MLDVQKYVPVKETQSDVTVDGCSFSIAQDKVYPVLFGVIRSQQHGTKVVKLLDALH